jgi:hypothetical protein
MLVEISAAAAKQKRRANKDKFPSHCPHIPLGEFTRR